MTETIGDLFILFWVIVVANSIIRGKISLKRFSRSRNDWGDYFATSTDLTNRSGGS
jgi:hypothetical protein